MKYVQACINSIGFPRDLDQLEAMWLKQNENDGDYELDIDVLLDYDRGGTHWWYAPKWIQPGDLMFFYQTGTGWKNARRLLNQCTKELEKTTLTQEEKEDADFFHELLLDANEILEEIQSTIFAVAEVDSIESVSGRVEGAHFAGNFFAPIKQIHVLDTVVCLEDFKDVITISQSTITPLLGERFAKLKQRINNFNDLPGWISNTAPTNQGFRDIDRSNWRELALSKQCGFVMEEQVRAFFLDYLLKEISDPKQSYYEECNCFDKNGKSLGRSDYFIRVEGNWLPIEAKIDVRNSDALEQAERYIRCNSFKPTRGSKAKSLHTINNNIPFCVICDRNGLYLADETGFLVGSPGSPWISRIEIGALSAKQIKRHLAECSEKFT